jgi:hypothetical protein
VCTYLLVAILKKTLKIDQSLSRILQTLSVNVFQKVNVGQLLTEFELNIDDAHFSKQLDFNELLAGQ